MAGTPQNMDVSSLYALSVLRDFRDFAFPRAIRDPAHIPYFSLEEPELWVQVQAIRAYIDLSKRPKPVVYPRGASVSHATPKELKEFRSFLLPPSIGSMPYFSLENTDIWALDEVYQVFCLFRTATPTVSQEETHSSRGSSPALDIVDLSSETTAPPAFQPEPSASRKRKRARSNSDAKPKKAKNPVGEHAHSAASTASTPSIKRSKTTNPSVAIKITSKECVSRIIQIEEAPSSFTVYPEPTAYFLDLSRDGALPNRFDGSELTISAFIRQENMDSWTGTGGRRKGDAFVINAFGEEKTWCRKVDLTCNGIKTCEFFDLDLLDGVQRFEADDSITEIFSLQLDQNEEGEYGAASLLAWFYARISQQCPKTSCTGKATLKHYSKGPRQGKTMFVGCSKWTKEEKYDHRFFTIDVDIDEDELRDLMRDNGKLQKDITVNGKCNFLVHPRTHRATCPYTHIIDGQTISEPKIKPRKCPSRTIIYEPLDVSLKCKAVVVVKIPHNHPFFPHAKPSQKEKDTLLAALDVSRPGVGANELRHSTSTKALLGGGTWESKLPGLSNRQLLRKLLQKQDKNRFPHGKDWPGVMWQATSMERNLPEHERYIHSCHFVGDIKICVTMHPRLAKILHGVVSLAVDFTFKRVAGETNEYAIAGWSDRYHKRIRFATLYCNKQTREAFRLLFREFFSTVEQVTKRPLEFHGLVGENSEAKLRGICFDAEVAQFQAFGDTLLGMNDPSVSGIHTTDPLEIAAAFSKSCSVHFARNVDKLSKNIPADVIRRLKDFPSLKTDDAIAAWRLFCESSEYKEVRSWYTHKCTHPWILNTLNAFLSPMDSESWHAVPSHTNLVETSHAGRNSETQTGMALLTAIEDARLADIQHVEYLEGVAGVVVIFMHQRTVMTIY